MGGVAWITFQLIVVLHISSVDSNQAADVREGASDQTCGKREKSLSGDLVALLAATSKRLDSITSVIM